MCIRLLKSEVVISTVNIYEQALTLVANRYLFHKNDNSHQIASVIEESCPKDLHSNLHTKSARHKLSSLWFIFPSFAVIINYSYFSVSQWNTSRRFLTLQAQEKKPPLTLTPKDMSWVTVWLSFLSVVNRRASCMLSHYLTKTAYIFLDTFT